MAMDPVKPTPSSDSIMTGPTDAASIQTETSTVHPEKDEFTSIYTREEKWFIVSVIAIAGLFSPLTSSIYFPAIPDIALAFNKSVELINLSVTVYMIFQGITPMFWGTFADHKGRRPIFIACLLILSLSCFGLALIPTSSYWLLLLLRCVQSAGSASTTALGAGVVGDITTREERGSMYGLYSVGPLIGPAIGPVIGGLINDKLGWRAIFWFLCIATAVCLIFLILFMPETLRAIVGDGSIVPSRLYRPLIPVVGRNRKASWSTERPKPKRLTNPLRLLLELDVISLLLFNGMIMGIFYTVATTLSQLFSEAYPYLSKSEIGYCYLATGGSMFIGTLVSGKIMDRDFKKLQERLNADAGENGGATVVYGRVNDDRSDFPIERARLGKCAIYVFFLVGSCAGYGWCLEKKVGIAGPLMMQIIYGFTAVCAVNATQTLLIDLVPTQGSSITACNNVIRCSAGAIIVAVIDPILRSIGAGWTFLILAALGALSSCFLLVNLKVGPRYRRQRLERQELAAAACSSAETISQPTESS